MPVRRGIRQGCPISGQFHGFAIEPLVRRLRSKLRGLSLSELVQSPPVVVSTYADDINVFVKDQGDVQALNESLALYAKASSARVNWGKSGACLVGKWSLESIPGLPGNLKWGKGGAEILGVYLGTEDFQRQNWEGVLDKVEMVATSPVLQGRTLIINNLVASSLWHRLIVLVPLPGHVKEVQRLLVWSALVEGTGLISPCGRGRTGTHRHSVQNCSLQTADSTEAAVWLQSWLVGSNLAASQESWATWAQ